MSASLDTIAVGVPCIVSGFDDSKWHENADAAALALRLMEMGLHEGVQVTKVHAAPISRDPVAVDIGGQLIALRRAEADAVYVKAVVSNQNEK